MIVKYFRILYVNLIVKRNKMRPDLLWNVVECPWTGRMDCVDVVWVVCSAVSFVQTFPKLWRSEKGNQKFFFVSLRVARALFAML